jgi:hypothetical protein
MVDKVERQEYERQSQVNKTISFETFKQAREKTREAWITRVMSKEFRDAEPDYMREMLSQIWGGVCLTEVPDSALMWNGYADSFRGFVAEFVCEWEHTTYIPRFRGTPFGPALKVEYTAKPPVFRPDFGNAASCLSTKTEEWSYEQEWRVIEFLWSADYVRQDNNYRFTNFAPVTLKRVICGDCMSEPDRRKILEMTHARGFEELELQKVQLDSTRRVIGFRSL